MVTGQSFGENLRQLQRALTRLAVILSSARRSATKATSVSVTRRGTAEINCRTTLYTFHGMHTLSLINVPINIGREKSNQKHPLEADQDSLYSRLIDCPTRIIVSLISVARQEEMAYSMGREAERQRNRSREKSRPTIKGSRFLLQRTQIPDSSPQLFFPARHLVER